MKTLFVRILDVDDKAEALLAAIQNITTTSQIYEARPANFSSIPRSPFAYWVLKRLWTIFQEFSSLETENRTAKQGLATADDFRFVRTTWEIAHNNVNRIWFPFAKGGSYSSFYADVHLLVNWHRDGAQVKNSLNERGQVRSNVWMLRSTATNNFFHPGLTWPLRTQKGLSFRVIPSQCIFGHKGPVIFSKGDFHIDLLALLAVTNSIAFRALAELQMAFGSYEVGVIQRTPVPDFSVKDKDLLAALAEKAWSLKYIMDTHTEAAHAFYLPALLQTDGENLLKRVTVWGNYIASTEQELADIQGQIDEYCFDFYRIDIIDRRNIEKGFDGIENSDSEANEDDDSDIEATEVDTDSLVARLVSWCVGADWGRWDIRLATIGNNIPKLPKPFEPLPICFPGILQNALGMPVNSRELALDYPLRISWSGILTDDPGHPEDIEQRVREVLRIIWPDRADAIEQEACEILGVASLRAYFANPSRFFDDHLKRYSKSRRAAPIYWPLSTPSGSYTLWLYYHRLTDQTLYSCVNDFVEPKLKQVNDTVATLQRRTNRSRLEEQELEQQSELALELAAFRDELLRIARCWQPNLNDGVQITAAPLWRLFQHRAWQKRLKETWEKLAAGDYDWAHLAYALWPERVREKCKADKSLAIAHELEGLYVEPVKPIKAKKGGGKKPVVVDEDEQGELL